MKKKSVIDERGISKEQLDLIEQFEADLNTIERALRRIAGEDKHNSFVHLVNLYARKHPNWRDADFLRIIADVRNAIVHGKTEPYRYVAVPTSALAQSLRNCRDRLMNPPRAIPTFQRKVEKVSVDDNLPTSYFKTLRRTIMKQAI